MSTNVETAKSGGLQSRGSVETLKLSIVTPTLNRYGYLQECIESVLQQDYTNIEHVIVDGASSDGTVPLLQSLHARYGDRIRWISQKDNGVSEAVNRGLAMATGDIIGSVGSDDKLAENAARIVTQYFAEHPEAQWIYGSYVEMGQDGEFRQLRKSEAFDHRLMLTRPGYICGPRVFQRAELVRRVGGVREDLLYAMDYEWALRMARVSVPHQLGEVLAYFRWHLGGITMSRRSAQIDETQRIALEFAKDPLLRGQVVFACKKAKLKAWVKRQLRHAELRGIRVLPRKAG